MVRHSFQCFNLFSSIFSVLAVMSLRDASEASSSIKWGTLRDLLVSAEDPTSQVVLNALSLPMGDVSLAAPPKYR